MVQFTFNAADYDPSAGAGSILETGVYLVAITKSDIQPTKNRDGHYLALTLTVQDGLSKGLSVVDRLNINNTNQQAVDIAYRTLSAICHVTGRINMQDTNELHGIPFVIEVEKKPRQDDPTKFTNDIKAYKDAAGNGPVRGQPGAGGGGGGGMTPPPAPQQQYQQPQVQQPNPPAQQQQQVAPPPAQQTQPWTPPAGQSAPVTGSNPPWLQQ